MGQTLPLPITAAMVTPAYVRTITYTGGAFGDDVSAATAATTDVYAPTTQAAKATALGTTIAVDVARPRGWLEPDDPYTAAPGAGANPTIGSLAPNTAVAGTGADLVMVVTGTNFTAWSTVTMGTVPVVARYVSPTKLEVAVKPRTAAAGATQVTVTDHGVTTAPSTFTFT